MVSEPKSARSRARGHVRKEDKFGRDQRGPSGDEVFRFDARNRLVQANPGSQARAQVERSIVARGAVENVAGLGLDGFDARCPRFGERIFDGLHVGAYLCLDGALAFARIDTKGAGPRVRTNAGVHGNADTIEARDVGNARYSQFARPLFGIGERSFRRRYAQARAQHGAFGHDPNMYYQPEPRDKWGCGAQNASIPVSARPRIKVCTSWVPS